MTDLEFNIICVAIAVSRWIVEASYTADWAKSITGKKIEAVASCSTHKIGQQEMDG